MPSQQVSFIQCMSVMGLPERGCCVSHASLQFTSHPLRGRRCEFDWWRQCSGVSEALLYHISFYGVGLKGLPGRGFCVSQAVVKSCLHQSIGGAGNCVSVSAAHTPRSTYSALQHILHSTPHTPQLLTPAFPVPPPPSYPPPAAPPPHPDPTHSTHRPTSASVTSTPSCAATSVPHWTTSPSTASAAASATTGHPAWTHTQLCSAPAAPPRSWGSPSQQTTSTLAAAAAAQTPTRPSHRALPSR